MQNRSKETLFYENEIVDAMKANDISKAQELLYYAEYYYIRNELEYFNKETNFFNSQSVISIEDACNSIITKAISEIQAFDPRKGSLNVFMNQFITEWKYNRSDGISLHYSRIISKMRKIDKIREEKGLDPAMLLDYYFALRNNGDSISTLSICMDIKNRTTNISLDQNLNEENKDFSLKDKLQDEYHISPEAYAESNERISFIRNAISELLPEEVAALCCYVCPELIDVYSSFFSEHGWDKLLEIYYALPSDFNDSGPVFPYAIFAEVTGVPLNKINRIISDAQLKFKNNPNIQKIIPNRLLFKKMNDFIAYIPLDITLMDMDYLEAQDSTDQSIS